MNLPNKLTVLRFIMVPFFMLFLCVPLPISDAWVRIGAAALFGLASLTDMLDGKIARKHGLVTNFGKLMDPLADKFMVFGAMLGIVYYCVDIRPVFVWAAALVMLRELAVTSLRMLAAAKDGNVIAAAWLGKVKTVTQVICILTVLLEPVIPCPFLRAYLPLSYLSVAAMAVMTVWSGLEYFLGYKDYLKE